MKNLSKSKTTNFENCNSIDVTNLCSGLYHAQLVYGNRFSWETKILIHTN